MSVHGEYSRALENVVSQLEALADERAPAWATQLSDARVARHPDLTSAARACLDALSSMQRDGRDPDEVSPAGARADALEGAIEHLLAHCRIVLGVTD